MKLKKLTFEQIEELFIKLSVTKEGEEIYYCVMQLNYNTDVIRANGSHIIKYHLQPLLINTDYLSTVLSLLTIYHELNERSLLDFCNSFQSAPTLKKLLFWFTFYEDYHFFQEHFHDILLKVNELANELLGKQETIDHLHKTLIAVTDIKTWLSQSTNHEEQTLLLCLLRHPDVLRAIFMMFIVDTTLNQLSHYLDASSKIQLQEIKKRLQNPEEYADLLQDDTATTMRL